MIDVNKKRKCNKPIAEDKLIQTNIFDSFNKWRDSQKMKKDKKRVLKFNSTLIIEIKDSDSEQEECIDYNSLIKERDLPFPFLFIDKQDDKNDATSTQIAGPPETYSENTTSVSSKSVDIGVNRPISIDQLTRPMASSTPLKLVELNNFHVKIQDISNVSESNTQTHSVSESISDTDSERTLIYQQSTSPNKTINVIEHRIIPFKFNELICSDYPNKVAGPIKKSINTLDVSQNESECKGTSSPIKRKVTEVETVSKRQKVNPRKGKKHLNKRLFDDDMESGKVPNSSMEKQGVNGSQDYTEKNGSRAKQKMKNRRRKERRSSSIDEVSKENESVHSAEKEVMATEKEATEGVQSTHTITKAPNKGNGKDSLKSIEEKQNVSPPNSPSQKKVTVSETTSNGTKKEGNIVEPEESTKTIQSKNKGKTLLKCAGDAEHLSKSNDHPSSNSPRKAKLIESEKIETKAEGKQMNVKYVTLIQELFNTVYETNNINNLLDDDKKAIDIFRDMNTNYQYVCVKLFTWKMRWYNIYKFCNRINLNMSDSNILEMYKFFKENGIVDTDFINDDVGTLLELLDLNDLKSVRDTFRLKKTLSTKKDIIENLLRSCRTQCTLTPKKSTLSILKEEIVQKLGKNVIKLNEGFHNAFHRTYVLATFANTEFSKMSDYFNNILHLRIALPDYSVENYTVFYTKDEFVRYATARKYKDGLEDVLGKNHMKSLQICKDIFEELQKTKNDENDYEDRYGNTPHLIRFTARAVYVSALSSAMNILATKFPMDVKEWLEYMIKEVNFPHRVGDWYYHLSWLYMNYLEPKDYTHAAKLIIKVLKEKKEHLSEVQFHQLGKRGKTLKVTKEHKISQLYHDTIAGLIPEPIDINGFPTLTVDASTIRSTVLSVELIALKHYIENGYTDGRHCEGTLVMATFTLFFWDIIYNGNQIVPGTFVSKVQRVPLDINSQHFYLNRKSAIDKRLKEIETAWSHDELIEFVKDKYEKYSHLVALCQVDSHINDAEMLEILVNCIGRVILAKIYERFVKNIRQYRSGMPDLLIWNVHTKKSKFVEVKGENDKLSIGQTLWLDYLRSIGADVEVCKVHSIGSKRKKVRKPKDNNTSMEPSTSASAGSPKLKQTERKVKVKSSTLQSTSFRSKSKKNVQKSKDKLSLSRAGPNSKKKKLNSEENVSMEITSDDDFEM